MPQQDKRRSDRYRVDVQARITVNGRRLSALVTDVSDDGAFLCTDRPLRLGVALRLEIPALAPDDAPFTAIVVPTRAVVPHGRRSGRRRGVGIRFLGLGGRSQTRWARFMRHVQLSRPEAIDRPLDRMLQTAGFRVDQLGNPRRQAGQASEEVLLRVRITGGAMAHRLYTRHVGRRGLFLRAATAASVGDACVVEVTHPYREDRFYFTAVVRYVSYDLDNPGVGVELLGLDRAGMLRFRAYIADLLVQLDDEPDLGTAVCQAA